MAKTRRRVFISAATSDAQLARELATRLQSIGIDAFNPATETLPGDNVSEVFGRALNRAEAVIVLVSPAGMKSPSVRNEIQFALGEERLQDRLIPVMARQTPKDAMPWILNTIQWATGDVDNIADHVVKALDAPRRREAGAEAH